MNVQEQMRLQVATNLDAYKVTLREILYMYHALGLERHLIRRGEYHRSRNYFDAGGDDVAVWRRLVRKGLAVKSPDGKAFAVSPEGIALCEAFALCEIVDR